MQSNSIDKCNLTPFGEKYGDKLKCEVSRYQETNTKKFRPFIPQKILLNRRNFNAVAVFFNT